MADDFVVQHVKCMQRQMPLLLPLLLLLLWLQHLLLGDNRIMLAETPQDDSCSILAGFLHAP